MQASHPRADMAATDFLLPAGETKELPLPAGWHSAVDQCIKMAAELNRPGLLYSVIVKPELAVFCHRALESRWLLPIREWQMGDG